MTGISYLDELYSPVTGCSGKNCPTKDTCWAKAMVKRFPAIHGITQGLGGSWAKDDFQPERIPFNQPQFHPDRLNKPLHWKKPRRIGVCFCGDLFDEQVKGHWRVDIYDVMAMCPNHQFFILTKQSENMEKTLTGHKWIQWEDNVYHGVTITSQADADRMIPELLRIPGKKWISIEPMLELIDLRMDGVRCTCGQWEQTPGYFHKTCPDCGKTRHKFIPEWIVLGCESGPKRSLCPHEWMIDVVEQCRAAGTPCFVKQVDMGGRVCTDITKFPKALQVRELP